MDFFENDKDIQIRINSLKIATDIAKSRVSHMTIIDIAKEIEKYIRGKYE